MAQRREKEVEEHKQRNHYHFTLTGERWTRSFQSFSDIERA